jgi:hypothetical protein
MINYFDQEHRLVRILLLFMNFLIFVFILINFDLDFIINFIIRLIFYKIFHIFQFMKVKNYIIH